MVHETFRLRCDKTASALSKNLSASRSKALTLLLHDASKVCPKTLAFSTLPFVCHSVASVGRIVNSSGISAIVKVFVVFNTTDTASASRNRTSARNNSTIARSEPKSLTSIKLKQASASVKDCIALAKEGADAATWQILS